MSGRHWLDLPRGRGPSQTPKFLSPGPPSPWLPALPIEKQFYRFRGEPRAPLCAGHLLGRLCKCRKRFNARGAGGGAPGEINFGSPPSPWGKGVGGMGAKKKAKGGVGGRQSGQAPRRVPPTPAEPATLGARPPSGTTAAGITSAAGDKPTSGRVVRPHLPVPRGFSPGDARGEAPCIK